MLDASRVKSYLDGGLYTLILNKIGEWKIIECHDLYKFFEGVCSYQTLKKKILVLEKDGLLKGVYLGNNNKHVYLTNIGIKFTPFDKTYEPTPEELTHDLQVGRIVQELLSYTKIKSATMYHQIADNYISPDAILKMESDDEEYNVALELELTQKSSRRIKAKISRYGISQSYDYCIFISHKPSLLNTYQRYLKDFKDEVGQKFYFVLMGKFTGFNAALKNIQCFYNYKKITEKGLFGAKNTDITYGTSVPNPLRPEVIL